MTEILKVLGYPPEPPLGTTVRTEPDDNRRWRRTAVTSPSGNWQLMNRRTDGGRDGGAFSSWHGLLYLPRDHEIRGDTPLAGLVIEADDLVPVGTVWRTGRKLGRTLYDQGGDQPSDSDPFIGMMDSREDAELVCELVNRAGQKELK